MSEEEEKTIKLMELAFKVVLAEDILLLKELANT